MERKPAKTKFNLPAQSPRSGSKMHRFSQLGSLPQGCPALRFTARFHLPRTHQMAVLCLPEARRWITWRQKVTIARAASAIMGGGLSLNNSARALGIAPSSLCGLLQKFRAGGEAALIPIPQGKSLRASTACKISFYINT